VTETGILRAGGGERGNEAKIPLLQTGGNKGWKKEGVMGQNFGLGEKTPKKRKGVLRGGDGCAESAAGAGCTVSRGKENGKY